MQVWFNVAMKCPNPRVISHKPQRGPSIRENHGGVPQRRILQVELAGVFLPEPPFSVAQHPEIVAVEVPRVYLAHVGRQRVGVLQNDVHGGVEPERVNPVANRGVGVQRRPHHVGQRHVVDGPFDVPVDEILGVEESFHSGETGGGEVGSFEAELGR
nr:hypothetical protein KK1_005806 [Ipomoea batatas]